MLQRSGSEQDLYDDVTGFNARFPQDVVTIIIEELSDHPVLRVVSDQLSQSMMDPDRIADKALSQVSISAESKSWCSEEAIPGTSANKTPIGTGELLTLKALQPKVDLLTQLAAHYTGDEEAEERVEENLESVWQWKEEEGLQQIKIIPAESSLYLWIPFDSSMDTEQSSLAIGGLSGALETQTSGECMWFAFFLGFHLFPLMSL
ncbi:uncharacterized protein LOC112551173 [Alligator sinensis]|uniref:Uncharacterized protein LOC112551173 n=1 Tax=Alligator sinensis TaxID=38654 RepID=A0A3Q0H7N3_ALLSI|nr:uncharacterized protein LOC112551173 [Alligator sinensis]